jgi:hypothetical protein
LARQDAIFRKYARKLLTSLSLLPVAQLFLRLRFCHFFQRCGICCSNFAHAPNWIPARANRSKRRLTTQPIAFALQLPAAKALAHLPTLSELAGTAVANHTGGQTARKGSTTLMQFRWVAGITLWSMLIGPVFDLSLERPSGDVRRPRIEVRHKHMERKPPPEIVSVVD